MTFAEFLAVRPPMVALIEPDHLYARRLLASAARELQIGPGAYLERSEGRGWSGSPDLLHRAGLDYGGSGEETAASSLASLMGAMRTSRERSDGRDPLLKNGMLVLHDLGPAVENPVLVRALADFAELAAGVQCGEALVLPRGVRPGAPLHSVLVQYHAPADPDRRYGELVDGLLQRLRVTDPAARPALCRMLQGLPLVAADFVARLTLMDCVRNPGPRSLAERLQTARKLYEQAATSAAP
jgi:hypothetical protein